MSRVVPLGVKPAIASSDAAVADAAKFLRRALTLDNYISASKRAALLDGLDQAAEAGELASTVVGAIPDEQRQQMSDAVVAAAKSINLQAIVNTFSPQELCVFRASLDHVGAQLSSDVIGELASVQTAMTSTIEAVISTGRSDLAIALCGDADALRPVVMGGMVEEQIRIAAATEMGDVTNLAATLHHAAAHLPPATDVQIDATKHTAAFGNEVSIALHNCDGILDRLVLWSRDGFGVVVAVGAHGWAWIVAMLETVLPRLRDGWEALRLLFTSLYDVFRALKDASFIVGTLLALQNAFEVVSGLFTTES